MADASTVDHPARGLTYALGIALLLSFAYLVFLVVDNHRVRVSLIDVRETAEAAWLEQAPAELSPQFVFDTTETLSAFESPVPIPTAQSGQPSAQALEIFREMIELIARSPLKPACWNSEWPTLIARSVSAATCRAFCADYAFLMVAMAEKTGIPARRLSMEGNDGLGGTSHVVAELWLQDLNKWVMFDPTTYSVVRNQAGVLLSAQEIRQALLTGRDAELRLEQATQRNAPMPAAQVLAYYRNRIRDLYYPTNNASEAAHRQSLLMRGVSYTEQALALLGPNALMVPRFVGRLLTTRSRYRLMDDFNSASLSPGLWFWSFRIVLGVMVVSLLGLLLTAIQRRRRGAAGR